MRYAKTVCSDAGHVFVRIIRKSVRVTESKVDPTTLGIVVNQLGFALAG